METLRRCPEHDPCQLPYVGALIWKDVKLKQGHKTKRCPKCNRWFFKSEWGKPKLKWSQIKGGGE